jgi:hypothetical protein
MMKDLKQGKEPEAPSIGPNEFPLHCTASDPDASRFGCWPPALHPGWMRLVPDEQWAVYLSALDAARETNTRHLLGGAFGLAGYTGRWRNTKDLDLYILPEQRQQLIAALQERAFVDLHEQLPYDRGWIYRATRDGIIVDLIWAMANRRAEVEPSWFAHSRPIRLRGEELQLIPAEELLWCKLYVLQRDRSDWPDLLNLLYAAGPHLDFARLMGRLQNDAPLFAAVLHVFTWLCPSRAAQLPKKWVDRFREADPGQTSDPRVEIERIRLLDSRPWFAAFQPEDKPLQL